MIIREGFNEKINYLHGIFHGRGIPPIPQNNNNIFLNIVGGEKTWNSSKWSDTWRKKKEKIIYLIMTPHTNPPQHTHTHKGQNYGVLWTSRFVMFGFFIFFYDKYSLCRHIYGNYYCFKLISWASPCLLLTSVENKSGASNLAMCLARCRPDRMLVCL